MSEPTEPTEAEREAELILAERTWPYVLELKYPVEFGKRTIKALTFQRGRLGIMGNLSLDGFPPTDKLMLIASRLCGEPLGVIEAIDPEDAPEVLTIALNFIARCRTGGRTAPRS